MIHDGLRITGKNLTLPQIAEIKMNLKKIGIIEYICSIKKSEH